LIASCRPRTADVTDHRRFRQSGTASAIPALRGTNRRDLADFYAAMLASRLLN
jgi:hypothetical protein